MGQEVIVLSKVLAAELNYGYEALLAAAVSTHGCRFPPGVGSSHQIEKR